MNEQLLKYRRDLHQIRELEFDLYLTQAYVKEQLESFGYITETVAKTGLVAFKKGTVEEAIAFRTDMDALPVTEKCDIDFKSKHEGKMHACGHDGHMAMLLGFAKYISTLETINKTIVFIFQPAEEGPGGARVIIDEKVLEKYHVNQILGLHLYPGIEEGKMGFANGPMTAQNGEFDVTIHAKSAHGAMPHLGQDAIIAQSHLVQAYQSIVSRNINPLKPSVITIGTINGGEARNIIAGEISLSGTIRVYDQNVYDLIIRRIEEINKGIELMFNVDITCKIVDYYPAVINDSSLFETAIHQYQPDEYEVVEPLMIAEDFAFYLKEIPGMFAFVGSKNENKGFVHPLHSNLFNFDEKILETGLDYYIKMAKALKII
ncbi:amidohydrolase [Mycoplasmatota bacterium]|nr:amidohydrolase [Mycoplasmatota bacterium]